MNKKHNIDKWRNQKQQKDTQNGIFTLRWSVGIFTFVRLAVNYRLAYATIK